MKTIALADLAAVTGGLATRVPVNTAGWIIAHTPGSEGGQLAKPTLPKPTLPKTTVPENTAGWVIQHTPVPPGFHIE